MGNNSYRTNKIYKKRIILLSDPKCAKMSLEVHYHTNELVKLRLVGQYLNKSM
jgi:hypothetical protein